MRLSFRTRLSLWYTLAVALILGVAGLGGNWALARTVLGQVDAALAALAEAEAAAFQADIDQPVHVHEMAPGTSPPSFVRLDRFVQIIDESGQVLATSANLGSARLPVPSEMVSRLRDGEIVFQTFDRFGEEPIRVVALPVTVGHTRYAVQVAGSLDDAYTLLNSARWLFLGLSVTVLAAAALTSVRFARRALRPIDEIVARARQIGESNLTERLPHPGSADELARLVDTLNEMLERIERGIETQRRFTADASHELRSPLSRLRAELEVTLRRPRESAEYEEALRSCLDEVERLSSLTEDLLTLAHLDADADRRLAAGAVPLSPILEEALRRLEIAAARCAVTVVLQPGLESLSVRANAAAVSLALSNVLDNAVKFSPAGGQVTVGVRANGPEAVVLISDTGPGVSAEELSGLFDRFHRGAAARAGDAPGFGLGLAISRAAIERAGGCIRAENRSEGGATFSIHLPRAS
jgi:two-component system OmpR family sensor kinase